MKSGNSSGARKVLVIVSLGLLTFIDVTDATILAAEQAFWNYWTSHRETVPFMEEPETFCRKIVPQGYSYMNSRRVPAQKVEITHQQNAVIKVDFIECGLGRIQGVGLYTYAKSPDCSYYEVRQITDKPPIFEVDKLPVWAFHETVTVTGQ